MTTKTEKKIIKHTGGKEKMEHCRCIAKLPWQKEFQHFVPLSNNKKMSRKKKHHMTAFLRFPFPQSYDFFALSLSLSFLCLGQFAYFSFLCIRIFPFFFLFPMHTKTSCKKTFFLVFPKNENEIESTRQISE